MFKKLLPLLLLFTGFSANAAILFTEDFEPYSLDSTSSLTSSSNWDSNINGIVKNDPIGGDKALTFNGVAGGVDLRTPHIYSSTGIFNISFDYLGTCNTGNCGGFFYNSLTGWVGTTTPYPDLLVDDGTWNTYDVTVSGSSVSLLFEDRNGSGPSYGDAWFDNILVTDGTVPEPSIIALFGLGLVGIGFARRRRS